MNKTTAVTGWLLSLILALTATAGAPRPASAALCNGFVEINYVAGPMPASPGDTVRVQMVMFTGPITDGANPTLTFTKVRFDLDCNTDMALALLCTDDGSVAKYQGNITSSGCLDAGSNPVTFSDNSAAGNFNPNEVTFTPSNPVVLPQNTADADGCVLEFDVQVASYSNDSTPAFIEEVGGWRTEAGTPDATCSNGLTSNQGQSTAIQLVSPPTPTPVPTSTPIPSICQGGEGGLIPGYCHSAEINDCVAEFCSPYVPPDTNVLHPSNSLTCKEGDPACDFGPAGDGICTFQLSLCFNVTDDRIACVAPDMVSRIRLSDPNETHPHPGADTDNRDALEAALLGLPGATLVNTPNRSILLTPPLTNTDICTSMAQIKVPLRQTTLGPRLRHKAVRYRVFQNPTDRRPIDRDILRLTCTP